MLVNDLITALRSKVEFDYQGDTDITFRGTAVKSTTRGLRRRFYLFLNDFWCELPNEWPRKNVSAELEGAFETSALDAIRSTKIHVPAVLQVGNLFVEAQENIEAAFQTGALGVICSNKLQGLPVFEGRNVFFAQNAHDFSYRMVEAVRDSLDDQRITAITGSAGKSTTKAMVTHALNELGAGRVLSAPGNQNIARDLRWQLSRAHRNDHVVVEVAGSAFLHFHRHSFTVSADVSVVTSIAEAHLDYLHDLENVARFKSDLFQRPPAGGTAVINIDVPYSELLVRRAVQEGCQLVTYGQSSQATIRLVDYDPTTRHVVAEVGQERIEYTVGAEGKHMAINSLAVIAVLRAHRIKNWRAGVESLASFEALGGRGKISQLTLDSGAEVTLIDEAYNANPASIRASLEYLSTRTVPGGSRRVAILGDVLELGEHAHAVHRNLADAVLDANLDELHLFGEHMAALHGEIADNLPQARHWEDLEALTLEVLDLLQTGDVVLVKASGGTGLKDFVKGLIRGEVVTAS
jgi:UDP-N-acetylmuramoyl-tripeptide--D-alanyl-D-alanine ligase